MRWRALSAALRPGVALGVGLFLACPADAEPSAAELAAAREIFKEARLAEDAGDWATALRKVRAVADVKMTAQVRFHLGLCNEKLGFLVEALNDFERAGAEADEQHVAAVAKEAPEHAAELRGRVPHLRFQRSAEMDDASVTIDGLPIASSMLAYPIPVNPGSHQIQVMASAGRHFREDVALREREERTVAVVFRAGPEPLDGGSFEDARPSPSNPQADTSGNDPAAPWTDAGLRGDAGSSEALSQDASAAENAAPFPASVSDRRSGYSTAGWIGVGTGGAMLVTAGIAAIVRANALGTIDERCPSHSLCPSDLRSEQDRARTFGAVGLTLGLLGSAAALGGAILVVTSRAQPQNGAVSLTTWATADGMGAQASVLW